MEGPDEGPDSELPHPPPTSSTSTNAGKLQSPSHHSTNHHPHLSPPDPHLTKPNPPNSELQKRNSSPSSHSSPNTSQASKSMQLITASQPPPPKPRAKQCFRRFRASFVMQNPTKCKTESWVSFWSSSGFGKGIPCCNRVASSWSFCGRERGRGSGGGEGGRFTQGGHAVTGRLTTVKASGRNLLVNRQVPYARTVCRSICQP